MHFPFQFPFIRVEAFVLSLDRRGEFVKERDKRRDKKSFERIRWYLFYHHLSILALDSLQVEGLRGRYWWNYSRRIWETSNTRVLARSQVTNYDTLQREQKSSPYHCLEFANLALNLLKTYIHTLTPTEVGSIKGNALGISNDDLMMDCYSNKAAPNGFARYDYRQMDFSIGGTSGDTYHILCWQTYLWAWNWFSLNTVKDTLGKRVKHSQFLSGGYWVSDV